VLVDELSRLYGEQVSSLKLIRPGQGGASVMEATFDGVRRALRISGPFLSSRPHWVEFEGRFLAQAKKSGVCAAAAILGVDGRYGQPLEDGIGLLTEWAEGNVEWPTPPVKAAALGGEIARLHRGTSGFGDPRSLRPFDTDGLLDRPLAFLGEITDVSTLRPHVEEMRGRIDAIEKTPATFGPIHGDVHQGNCHFDGDRVTLFDFAQSGVGWRAFDLAGFLWPWRDDHINDPATRAACDAYLAGYKAVRPLTDAEERALPAFIRARDLWEAGEWVAAGDGRDKPEDVCRAVEYWVGQWAASGLKGRKPPAKGVSPGTSKAKRIALKGRKLSPRP
jgi:Ser/Thr protein kinase RdoA (MazF antagonist)